MFYHQIDSAANVISEIEDAINEIAEDNDNECIDFEDFFDILQQLDVDQNDEYFDKQSLRHFFSALLSILDCDSDELNIDKFTRHMLTEYKSYDERNAVSEQSTCSFLKHLVHSTMSSTTATSTVSNGHYANGSYGHLPNHSDHREPSPDAMMMMSNHRHLPPEMVLSIGADLNEYLEGEQAMDYQEFSGFCRDYVGDSYSERTLKVVFQSMSNEDSEVTESQFLRMIAECGHHEVGADDIGDVVASALDAKGHQALCLKVW